jgi:hypothetical protein
LPAKSNAANQPRALLDITDRPPGAVPDDTPSRRDQAVTKVKPVSDQGEPVRRAPNRSQGVLLRQPAARAKIVGKLGDGVPIFAKNILGPSRRNLPQRLDLMHMAVADDRGAAAEILEVAAGPTRLEVCKRPQLARSPADGYTLLLANTMNAINATLFEKLSYDFLRDIAPVASIARIPSVMEVHPSLPVRTVRNSSSMPKPIRARST